MSLGRGLASLQAPGRLALCQLSRSLELFASKEARSRLRGSLACLGSRPLHHALWKLQDRTAQTQETGHLPLRIIKQIPQALQTHYHCHGRKPKLHQSAIITQPAKHMHQCGPISLPLHPSKSCQGVPWNSHVSSETLFIPKVFRKPSLFFHALAKTWLFHKNDSSSFPFAPWSDSYLFLPTPCHMGSGTGELSFPLPIAEIKLSIVVP